jgi:hypothetical protein
MKIEERLHDAMHEYADTIEPEPGSWSKIEARFDEAPAPRRPARGGLVFAGVALTLVVALTAVLVVRDRDDSTRVATGPAAGMPSRIVALTSILDLVVLDSASGRVVRALARDVSVVRGLPAIAPTPDGKAVFFTSYSRADSSDPCAGTEVVSKVGVGGGAVEQLGPGSGRTVAVSPDGRWLATAGGSDIGCTTHPYLGIVLRDLQSGTTRIIQNTSGLAFSLSWAADSRHLAFQWDKADDGGGSAYVLDTQTGSSFDEARCVCGQTDAYGWFGYLGATGDFLGAFTPAGNSTETGRVVALSPDGSEHRTLFRWSDRVRDLRSDQSGTQVLMTTDRGLYRWSEGEKEPTKIADGVIGAAWIPDSSPEPPPVPASTAMPGALLAAVDGNRLALLASANGSEQTSYGSFLGISSVSVTPGGKEIVFSYTGQSGACGDQPAPEVDRLNPDTLAATRIVGGAVTPVVSPDGKFVAYGITCDGPALGLTNLATGENYRTDPLGGTKRETAANIESVEVLGWSPNSRRMLYRLTLRGEKQPHYYVGSLWPAVRQSDTKVVELPSGSNLSTAAFADDETVAMAIVTGDRTAVYEMPIKAKAELKSARGLKWDKQALLVTGDGMFEVEGPITSLVPDPSGRHFLALADPRALVPRLAQLRPPIGPLYRWSVGDGAPTKIADSVAAASWAPWW